MRIFYSFGINVYVFLITLAALFGNKKAKLWRKGRKGLMKVYENYFAEKDPWTYIWIHVSSLGEFEQGRPLIEAIKKNYPEQKILLTFFSPSGYEIRKDYPYADYIQYLPADRFFAMSKLVQLIRPKVALFIKYDFWFNFMYVLRQKGVPIYFISSVFRKRQFIFQWFAMWFRKHLTYVDTFFVQNEESETLLNKKGFYNAEFVGDTRLDRVLKIVQENKMFPDVERFIAGRNVVMLGSSWPKDEEFFSKYAKSIPDIVFIIAPHDISEKRLKQVVRLFNEPVVRFSELKSYTGNQRILLIDTIGDLARLYKYATVVHIGNGFGKGIHNILEPVVFSKPVVFGPNYRMFPEAVHLVKVGGAFSFSSFSEYSAILNKLLFDVQERESASDICRTYVEKYSGATDTIMHHVEYYFWSQKENSV